MLNTPRDCRHEGFLEGGVNVSVGKHKLQPTIPEEGGEELAMHGVRAIGRKFPGSEGFWPAEPLLISQIAATFH